MVDVNARRKMCTLVAAAFIDGNFGDEEFEMIIRKGEEMGLPRKMILEIVKLGKKGSLAISVPPTLKQKEELLDDLIDIACADGKLEKEENHLLMKFSRQVGLSIHDLGKRVKERLTKRRRVSKPRDVIEDGIVILDEEPTRQKPKSQEPERAAKPVEKTKELPEWNSSPKPAPKRPVIGDAYKQDYSYTSSTNKLSSSSLGLSPKPKYAGQPDQPVGDIGSGEDLLEPHPPGPVQLDGPGLGRIQDEGQIGIVTEQLLKQVLLINSEDMAHSEGVAFLKKNCGIEDEKTAHDIIHNVMKRNPDLKFGKLHDELGMRH